MTGFGKDVQLLADKKITVEIKSLNSKQFDMSTRVPSGYRELDLILRNQVATVLQRGKVEMVVSVETFGQDVNVHLNVETLAQYKQQIVEASKTLDIPEPADWYAVLLRFPETMHQESDNGISEAETEAVKLAVGNAVAGVMEHRRAEGLRLEDFFTKRIQKIASLLNQVEQYEGERITRIRERLADGISKIPALEFDKGRLEQEMIFYIEKLDVNEEKQRLAQHLNYFIQTMNAPEGSQGKKLGFIAQEMGREINTLGSKSNHASMQQLVVMMKDELEQIKEQVLNIM